MSKTLHIIFISGINTMIACEVTRTLDKYNSLPFWHTLKVVGFPGGERKLLGTVVVSEKSQSMLGDDPIPFNVESLGEGVLA